MAVTPPVHGRVYTRPSARSCTRSCTLLCTGRKHGRALRAVYTAVYVTGRLHGPVHDRVRAVYTKLQLSNRLIVTGNKNNVEIYSYISDGPYEKYSLTPSH